MFHSMKTIGLLILILLGALVTAGCADKKAFEEKARQDADAKARAEAARKEMQTLPQAFRPRYNKKLEPDKATTTTPAAEPTKKP